MNVDKIASRAAGIRPVRVLLTIIASPLYLLGFIVGAIFVMSVWLWAGTVEGFTSGRALVSPARHGEP